MNFTILPYLVHSCCTSTPMLHFFLYIFFVFSFSSSSWPRKSNHEFTFFALFFFSVRLNKKIKVPRKTIVKQCCVPSYRVRGPSILKPKPSYKLIQALISLHLTGTIIAALMHRIPSELRREACLGESSTRMGDLLGSPRVALLFVFLFCVLSLFLAYTIKP